MPPKSKTKETEADRLQYLLLKLEDRLAIFNEGELKRKCLYFLIEMRNLLDQLESHHSKLCDIMGATYQEIHYPPPDLAPGPPCPETSNL